MRTIHDLSENFSDGLLFPKGTSAERGNPEAGYFRYNTETKGIEVYDGTSWSSMDNTPSYVTDGLVLNLDAGNLNSYDGSGNTWSDLAQDGNDGTVNGATYDSSGYFAFDGNDSVDLGNDEIFTLANRKASWEAWVKFDNATGANAILTKWENNSSENWWFGRYDYDKIHLAFRINGVYYPYVSSGSVLNQANTWYQACGTLNGTDLKFYINGALDSSFSVASGTWNSSSSKMAVGCQNLTAGGAAFMDGGIGAIRCYDKVLSSDEITQNFNATKTRFGL